MALIWLLVEQELAILAEKDEEISSSLYRIISNDEDLVAAVKDLPKTDPRRLAVLNPKLLDRALQSKKSIHLKVSQHLDIIQDILFVQRCQASSLPQKNGPPVPLRGQFQKMTRKTAVIERLPVEELEYQIFHREAAK